MAKELPYFQFEPAQYLTGNIQFCTLDAQGLFINICAIYWQRECSLTLNQILKKFNKNDLINELIENEVIKTNFDNIIIEFLDEQFDTITKSKSRLSEAGRKGALIKKQATLKPHLSEALTTLKQPDKIKEDKIKENDIKESIEQRKLKFSESLKPFLITYGKDMLNDFYSYWTEPNKSGTKFKKELQVTWDTERRLKTWANNSFGNKNNKQPFEKPKGGRVLED